MGKVRARAAISLWTLCACSSGDAPATDVGGGASAIVYGTDDRRDVYEVEDAAFRAIAQHAIVALVLDNQVLRPAAGGVKLITKPLRETRTQIQANASYFPLCEGEPFLDQPVLADCTGVLIDDDLVLTAGHCFGDGRTCDDYLFVFDYYERAEGELETVSPSDVYGCAEVVAERLSTESGARIDFAVVRLDRVAQGRAPVKLRSSALAEGEALAAIGYPAGLPAKIDQGARVVEARTETRDFFYLDSDTFKGSSGSGIFDAKHELVGVLVRGGQDFVMSPGEQCLVTNRVSDRDGGPPGQSWEEATYAKRALDALCQLGYPTKRLCGAAPRCGDKFCTRGESVDNCPADCLDEGCIGASCSKARNVPVLGEVVEPPDAGAPARDDAGADTKAGDDSGCALAHGGREGLAPWLALLGVFARRRRRSARR